MSITAVPELQDPLRLFALAGTLPAERDRESAGLAALARLAAGEDEALGEVYDLFSEEIFAFALWVTGCRADAADVVQEVFVRLLRRSRKLGRITRPRAYLLRAARRVAIDLHRRRRPTHQLDGELLVAPAIDPDRGLDAEKLTRWLRRLPPGQRGALYLRSFGELSYAEIGRILGIPTFTAASRCRLASARLRRWFERGGPE